MLIPKNKLKAALLHAGDRDVRSYLNGVRVVYDGAKELQLIGTAGYTLFAGRIEVDSHDTPAFALTIPRDSLKMALASRDKFLDLQLGEAAHRLGDVLFEEIGGKFPEWRTIVPLKHDANAEGLFKWDQLDLARKALALWHDAPKCAPTIVRQTAGGAGVATAVDSSAFVVIMPLRPEQIERPAPWL